MIGFRLRALVRAYNRAATDYALARLEIATAHPRIIAPPVIDRLGSYQRSRNDGYVWRAAVRQVRAGEQYVRTGASAVARRHPAWLRLAASFALVKRHAAGIEALRVARARIRRHRT